LIEEFYNERFDYDRLRDKLMNNYDQKYTTFYEYDVLQYQVDFHLFFVDDNV
jgi:hypothetical protein